MNDGSLEAAAHDPSSGDGGCWKVMYFIYKKRFADRYDPKSSRTAGIFTQGESPWQFQVDFIDQRADSRLRRIERSNPFDDLYCLRPLALVPWVQKELPELPAYEYVGKHDQPEYCWIEKHDTGGQNTTGTSDDSDAAPECNAADRSLNALEATVSLPQRPATQSTTSEPPSIPYNHVFERDVAAYSVQKNAATSHYGQHLRPQYMSGMIGGGMSAAYPATNPFLRWPEAQATTLDPRNLHMNLPRLQYGVASARTFQNYPFLG